MERVHLPNRRDRDTVTRLEVEVSGIRCFLTTGEYDDGTLGEIFIDIERASLPKDIREEGAQAALEVTDTLKSVFSLLAVSVSLGLQHGTPLSEYVDAFAHTNFPPQGMVQGSDRIAFAKSLADWIFRELGLRYLGREEYANRR